MVSSGGICSRIARRRLRARRSEAAGASSGLSGTGGRSGIINSAVGEFRPPSKSTRSR
jgi:hypothetical protein